MRIEVKKSGSNSKGVWVYGTAIVGDFDLLGVFATNLKDIPKEGSILEFKKIKILTGKNNKYQLEF